MCFFLTVAVPSQHAERIGEVFSRGFETHPTANPSMMAALPAGYTACLITSGMCSCDLYARPHSAEAPDPASHLRRKYQKRGWSEAKIRRALEQIEMSASKRNRPVSGFRSDVLQAIAVLCRAAGSIVLVVHWYNGDVETEQLSLHHADPCDCGQFSERAQQLDEDAVLMVTDRRTAKHS